MKLKVKLTIAMVLVALAATFMAATTSGFATRKLFEDYVLHQRETRMAQWEAVFSAYYGQNASWDQVQNLLNFTRGRGRGAGWRLGGERVVLADIDGRIVGDSEVSMLGKMMGSGTLAQAVPIMWGERKVGYLFLTSRSRANQGLASLEQEFQASVNKAVRRGGLAAALLAVGLGIAFSGRLTFPLVKLTEAAKKLAGKELSCRVEITSRDEIGELAQAFNAMADNLERNERIRQNLVADVAHELRTPLAILRGNLESLQEGVVEPTPAILASLHDEVLRMSRLVSDLQELSLVEAGILPLQLQPVFLHELAEQVGMLFAAEAAAKEVRLIIDVSSDLPPAQIDRDRIAQVMLNLLANALRYTKAGGSITLSAAREGERLCLQVKDTGVGIKAEELPHIFDRFFRGDKSRSRAEGGGGLGLAIAKGFVEAHGGEIWAESSLGEGSTFYLTLPLFKE
ncbi:MAG: ATP-binding protein [Bacillota bacterium]